MAMAISFLTCCLAAALTIKIATAAVDNSWHPPETSAISDLDLNLDSDGVFGFIFNSSDTPDEHYGQYNYCNMPHVRRREYEKAPEGYELVYVEVIHRHHKRTPYKSNTFPTEEYAWNCNDTHLYYYGQPTTNARNNPSTTFWMVEDNPLDVFPVEGFPGSCAFPQITSAGLEDSWQHGRDVFEVYHDLLGFLPDTLDSQKMHFRVTNNVITSQVIGMVIAGMYDVQNNVPLHVQKKGIDSLEPQYSCPGGSYIFDTIKASDIGSTPWTRHLEKTAELLKSLDLVSGVPPDAKGWHASYDHYFDSLSSRLCHSKPLPCSPDNPSQCISQSQANAVLRLGQWEYSYLYRSAPSSLTASTALYGVFIAELAQHLRAQIDILSSPDNDGDSNRVIYTHNVAHDGSISRLLSILQVRKMVWPGMGAELVFELYRNNRQKTQGDQNFSVRVLWGGRVLESSNPELQGSEEGMLRAEKLLEYFDSLVGRGGKSVLGLCR